MDMTRTGSTAGIIALTAAGLIAVTPTVLPLTGPTSPNISLTNSAADDASSAASAAAELSSSFASLQSIFNEAQSQVADGFSYLGAGEWLLGLDAITVGMTNMTLYGPLAGLLSVFDNTLLDSAHWYLGEGYFLHWAGDPTGLINEATNLITEGFKEVLAGSFFPGLSDIAYGVTDIVPDLPVSLLFTSLIQIDDFAGF